MPIKPLAELVEVHPNSIWIIVGHYVKEAHDQIDISDLKHVGVDECSREKGHKYFTVFGDLAKSRVIFVADERESETVKELYDFIENKGVDPQQIKEFCSDMWPAYITGIETNFPEASITFDRFHLMTKINKAVDKVRIEEVKERSELKNTKYIWRKNQQNLTDKQYSRFNTLKDLNLKTVRAYKSK